MASSEWAELAAESGHEAASSLSALSEWAQVVGDADVAQQWAQLAAESGDEAASSPLSALSDLPQVDGDADVAQQVGPIGRMLAAGAAAAHRPRRVASVFQRYRALHHHFLLILQIRLRTYYLHNSDRVRAEHN